jgi:predicted hydrocarbon binding protein
VERHNGQQSSGAEPAPFIGISMPTLRRLRDAAARDNSEAAIDALREAGYEGGASVYRAFTEWAAGEGAESVHDLDIEEFGQLLARFFSSAGWGTLTLKPIGEMLALVELDDSWESDPARAEPFPGCHITTGSLAGFFEQLSSAELAAFETSCRSSGDARCEFVLGNPDAIQFAYEKISAGIRPEELAKS